VAASRDQPVDDDVFRSRRGLPGRLAPLKLNRQTWAAQARGASPPGCARKCDSGVRRPGAGRLKFDKSGTSAPKPCLRKYTASGPARWALQPATSRARGTSPLSPPMRSGVATPLSDGRDRRRGAVSVPRMTFAVGAAEQGDGDLVAIAYRRSPVSVAVESRRRTGRCSGT
jgi:hypothetical protein